MKSIRYIIAISIVTIFCSLRVDACGPYPVADPTHIRMFRSCSPELERQWQEGCRFQDYEKDENCLLWQRITSSAIPLMDIENVVYNAKLKDLKDLSTGNFASNKFAGWLNQTNHREDLDYLLIAKEIEEIREFMNNPWYYPYDGDEEHLRLEELMKKCLTYKGSRHAARYALQMTRLYFAQKNFQSCIDLWENSVTKLPQDIVTNMIASYVGGAYSRKGNREKAIELFTRSQDIGSLINLKAWADTEEKSKYTDARVKELEYIFNRFPNSPLLSVKLQEYVRNREEVVYNFEDWAARDFHDPVWVKYKYVRDSIDEPVFYNELKRFANNVVRAKQCRQKGMWYYALAYLHHLNGKRESAIALLSKAEQSEATPFIKESIKAFRFLTDAAYANNSSEYRSRLLQYIKWLDGMMQQDIGLYADDNWQYENKMNWSFYYWQDVVRKVLLGDVCPKIEKSGNTTLALQLANYASNRCYQLVPLYEAYHYGWNDKEDPESYTSILPFGEYRKTWSGNNWFDYSSQFFEWINGVSPDNAAKYARRIVKPVSDLDKFLNERSYVDNDYICDIVGTLYLREMNYAKAAEWLGKVATDYPARTNIAKEGYFKLDPFRYQFDKEQFVADSSDYKLKFAQEMVRLENMISSDVESNRKANAKIRYAIGLRNSFGKCWYLTEYGYTLGYESGDDRLRLFSSSDRKGFKENQFAQKAYRKVDSLMAEAISEFTDPEQAAQAQLEMMNFSAVMRQYPNSKAATFVSGHCDSYYDYSLQKR